MVFAGDDGVSVPLTGLARFGAAGSVSGTAGSASGCSSIFWSGRGGSSKVAPVILAQHSAKEERAAREKGKWSTNLSSYAHLSAEELHSGFSNRLHSNRDYEAGAFGCYTEESYIITLVKYRFCFH